MTFLASIFLLLCILAGFVFFASLALAALQLVLLATVGAFRWIGQVIFRRTP